MCCVRCLSQEIYDRLQEFPPVIYRASIEKDMLQESHIKNHEDFEERMKHAQTQIISALNCKEPYLFSSDQVRQFMDFGLEIYDVREVFQYRLEEALRTFFEDAIRKRQRVHEQGNKVAVDFYKSIGNRLVNIGFGDFYRFQKLYIYKYFSFYGSLSLKLDYNRDTRVMGDNQYYYEHALDPMMTDALEVPGGMWQVQKKPATVHHNMPVHLAAWTLCNSFFFCKVNKYIWKISSFQFQNFIKYL